MSTSCLSFLALPARCCVCGARGARPTLDLCSSCAGQLPECRDVTCPAGFDAVVAPFAYAYPVDHLIRGLKFRGDRVFARVLGALLADAVSSRGAPHGLVVVPLPLHARRYRERGFNQAHELARHVARESSLPLAAGQLVRTRETLEQSSLGPGARRRNVRGAFALGRPLRSPSVALVDDVLTTGSTATEAAVVLRQGGAERVELWVAARAAPGVSLASEPMPVPAS